MPKIKDFLSKIRSIIETFFSDDPEDKDLCKEMRNELMRFLEKLFYSFIKLVALFIFVFSINYVYEYLFPNGEPLIDKILYHKGIAYTVAFLVAFSKLIYDDIYLFLKNIINKFRQRSASSGTSTVTH